MKDKMIKAGKISDIPEGEGRVFRSGRNEIAVFRLAAEIQGSSGQGSQGSRIPSNPRILEPSSIVVAIDNRCPHHAGPLADGIVSGDLVICPLHGHKFNLKTGESTGDEGKIKTYPVFVDGEEVFMENDLIS
ncbi:MAG: nitrite reductase (NAD(P)H) small subunit [Nitrospirae bacterium]|nr:nitrite reductase (NAD(P)H) small subunit [Nitrospirota bacterium]